MVYHIKNATCCHVFRWPGAKVDVAAKGESMVLVQGDQLVGEVGGEVFNDIVNWLNQGTIVQAEVS